MSEYNDIILIEENQRLKQKLEKLEEKIVLMKQRKTKVNKIKEYIALHFANIIDTDECLDSHKIYGICYVFLFIFFIMYIASFCYSIYLKI